MLHRPGPAIIAGPGPGWTGLICTAGACPMDLCRRERPHERGMGRRAGDRKAQKEPMVGLWATTIPGPRRKRASVFAGVGLRSEAPVRWTRSRQGLRDTARWLV